jgi:hypothetical protein
MTAEELLKAQDALIKASGSQCKILNGINCYHPRGAKILEYLRRGSDDARFSSHYVVANDGNAIARDLQASGDEGSMSSDISESEEGKQRPTCLRANMIFHAPLNLI